MNIFEYDTNIDMVKSIANDFIDLSKNSCSNIVNIALSGGSTPQALFSLLATETYRDCINWEKLHFWWGDERFVSKDSKESNFGTAYRLLFNQIPNFNSINLHPIRFGKSIKESRDSYSREMKELISSKHGIPVFDWCLLGMGDDGHTASLFPNDKALNSIELTEIVRHPITLQERVTITLPVINLARRISILVSGSKKNKMLAEVLENKSEKNKYPISHVCSSNNNLEWHVDTDAFGKINIDQYKYVKVNH